MTSSIRLGTAAVTRALLHLTTQLASPDAKFGHLIDLGALEDEAGRLRVWTGNLGALQKGHSSLDYRLRDSPLLSDNVLKLLQELEVNLCEMINVVSGSRLPYEEQAKNIESPEDLDDDFYSDDEDEDEADGQDPDSGAPKTELEQRFREIVDIVDNLYKLSVRIRQPTAHSRSLKAASYRPKDPESGVDILEQYANFDLQHTRELIRDMRTPHTSDSVADDSFLVERLSGAITLRRRQFKYWRRHREKLDVSTLREEDPQQFAIPIERPEGPPRHDTLEVHPEIPIIKAFKDAPSEKTGKTLLSGTEATHHHQSLDDIVDSKSVTSYATTVRDLTGRGIDLPPPPKGADGERDFECPYCFIICPSRYGKGRPWRTHILQDLQPYLCTYPDCSTPEQLFRSRREWSEHEANHRKAWRCPEHPTAIYRTSSGLHDHFRQEHSDSFPDHQLDSIVKIGETSTVDMREKCPICLAPADMLRTSGLQNHIANHLERLASFSLPASGSENDSDGASSIASRGDTVTTISSQDLSPANSDGRISYNQDQEDEKDETNLQTVDQENLDYETGQDNDVLRLVSAEALNNLPDFSEQRMDIFLSNKSFGLEAEDKPTATLQSPLISPFIREENGSISTSSLTSAEEQEDEDEYQDEEGHESDGKPPITSPFDIPTLRTLYKSRILVQRDQSFAPDTAYNQLIALWFGDITRLSIDCIVNSGNRAMKMTYSNDTLNHIVHKAAGIRMRNKLKKLGRVETGGVRLTAGYHLPCQYVIHAARPRYSGAGGAIKSMSILAECYWRVLKEAMSHGIRTIAFPCLGAGGCSFPSGVAARIALQEVRRFLDTHKNHGFDKLVFCVYDETNDRAYKDLLPVFFPPTHRDLENVASADAAPKDHGFLVARLQDVLNEVQHLVRDLVDLSENIASFPSDVLSNAVAILSALKSSKDCLSHPAHSMADLTPSNTQDINLMCSVLEVICGSVTEMVEQVKYTRNFDARHHQVIWDDYNFHMTNAHGFNSQELFKSCQSFVVSLANVIERMGPEPEDMATMREILEKYRSKQIGDSEYIQEQPEERLQTRELMKKRIASSQRASTIKLHEIHSLARLYQMGELAYHPTNAVPDTRQLHSVCLVREDITRLEVDVIANSTDPQRFGLGTLDRTVFRKGGPEMAEAVSNLGKCQEGDAKVTPGFLLPAKYVIHTIPPEIMRTDTKDVIRKIYRDVLFIASGLKAVSVAIPAIGTGMLNYSRRDCASLAMEEVKRFLETTGTTTTLEKIIFCVYGSNDEFVYKTLLPVYFPHHNAKVERPTGALSVVDQEAASSASTETSPPRRTLFGSIGEAIRGVRFSKQPIREASRSLQPEETRVLDKYESHARDCPTCSNILKLYNEGRNLCVDGYAAAQVVLQYFHMDQNRNVYSLDPEGDKRTKVVIPPDYKHSWNLLVTTESSFRDETRDRPFVSTSRPYRFPEETYAASPTGVSIQSKVTIPDINKGEKFFAWVSSWSESEQDLKLLHPSKCTLLVYPGRVDVYEQENASDTMLLLTLNLTSDTPLVKTGRTDVSISTRTLQGPKLEVPEEIRFRSDDIMQCEKLFQKLKSARTSSGAHIKRSSAQQDHVSTARVEEEDESNRPLKCPYYQRRPSLHDRWSCRLTTFRSIGELRRHIERIHTTGPACECHVNGQSCQKTEALLKDMDSNQIRFVDESPFEQWKWIFKKLFGNEETLPTPYEEAQTVYDQGLAQDQNVGESQMLDLPAVPSDDPSIPRSRPISALTQQLQAEQLNVSSSPISSPSFERVVKHTNQALAERVLSLLQTPEYAGIGLLCQDIADKASTPLASVYLVVDYLFDLELVESLGDGRIRATAAPQVNTQPPGVTSSSPLEQPLFICTECKREFPSSKELLRHDVKHPRPWKCTFQGCQYQGVGFTTENARDRHMEQIHNMRESSPWASENEFKKIEEGMKIMEWKEEIKDRARTRLGDIEEEGEEVVEGSKNISQPGIQLDELAALDSKGTFSLAVRILAHLRITPQSDNGLHINAIAEGLHEDADEVRRVGEQLLALHLIRSTTNGETWTLSDSGHAVTKTYLYRLLPTDPSQVMSQATAEPDLSTINLGDFFSYLHSQRAIHTRIHKLIVSAQALEEANERFEQRDNYMFVMRYLTRDEIRKFAERTKEIREGKDEIKGRARTRLGDVEEEG